MKHLKTKLHTGVLQQKAPIFVAGHHGMVGSAIVRLLESKGFNNIVKRTHRELDLTNQAEVNIFFQNQKIDAVVLAAAKVGGILANNHYRADFIYKNLAIQCNVIHAAFKAGIERLLFLGSSCIYPKQCPQPIKEEYLLSGYLEPTNEPYAIAKIAGIKLCESYNRQYGTKYRALMPTNLYGPNDNFDLQNSHVMAALIRKFHLAKLAANKDFNAIRNDEAFFGPLTNEVKNALGITGKRNHFDTPAVHLWGTGEPLREFLHVDDIADACFCILQMPDVEYQNILEPKGSNGFTHEENISHINVGYGKDVTIKHLAQEIQNITQFKGNVIWDQSKPNGMKRKLLDISRLSVAGWKPKIRLADGIRHTYNWYLSQTCKQT
jgi:GDP-L-fucose synthase